MKEAFGKERVFKSWNQFYVYKGIFKHDYMRVLLLKSYLIFHDVLRKVPNGFILKNHIIFVFNLDHMLGLEKRWVLINQMAFSLDVK
jgi:hypothetical protein